jgi:hypothetical protein
MARDCCSQARVRAEEIRQDIWVPRAAEAGLPLETFCEIAEDMNRRKVIRSLLHFPRTRQAARGRRTSTRFNALFHWAVPPGAKSKRAEEVGRHHIMTHAYWREGGPEFRNVNVMGVAHGTNKDVVLLHKAAIDEHLRGIGIRSPTRMFSGVAGARLSPRKFHRSPIGSGASASASTPNSLRE